MPVCHIFFFILMTSGFPLLSCDPFDLLPIIICVVQSLRVEQLGGHVNAFNVACIGNFLSGVELTRLFSNFYLC